MLSVELIPIFKDNYVFLISDSATGQAVIVDPGEATDAIKILEEKKLKLKAILITHHHADHIDGIGELKSKFQAEVFAPEKNKLQIPFVDHWVAENSKIEIGNFKARVIELPGHTLGHIGYHFQKENWLFSGDVLFGLGCGRLFEGTFEQMFQTLSKLKNLPLDTEIFCAHEYTETNLRFCQSLLSTPDVSKIVDQAGLSDYEEKLKKKRQQNNPSVPLLLATEISTSPFLKAQNVSQFTAVRQMRNVF